MNNKIQLDTAIHRGKSGRPGIIFIHGLGMDREFWIEPAETMILARNVPMRYFAASHPLVRKSRPRRKITIGEVPESICNLWHSVVGEGFSALCWSQRRPVGPISVAVEELAEIVAIAREMFPDAPIVFICHSRGGLIARKYMESDAQGIRALITLATPHSGSSLTTFAKHLSPVSSSLKKVIPEDSHGTATVVMKNVIELISSTALKELLPGSDFIRGLSIAPEKGVEYLSFGGTDAEMLNMYSWKKRDGMYHPKKLLTIPGSFLKILPPSVVPNEMKPGIGDFMVTAESARLPWKSEHINVSANHITITWHPKVIKKTLALLYRISGV